MSFEKAKADLEEKGLGDHVIVLNESSATVAEAAHALGVEPASIAKTLSVLQGEKPVLIVTEGTAKLDNHKYKSLFHIKAKMIPYDEVEAYVGHAPGGVCPFGVNEGVAVYLDAFFSPYNHPFTSSLTVLFSFSSFRISSSASSTHRAKVSKDTAIANVGNRWMNKS